MVMFKRWYRIRPGRCTWRVIQLFKSNYCFYFPITKNIFKLEPPKMWFFFGKITNKK